MQTIFFSVKHLCAKKLANTSPVGDEVSSRIYEVLKKSLSFSDHLGQLTLRRGYAALFVLILSLTVGVGNVLGASITYTFSSKAWAASPANWSGTKDGNQFNSSGTPLGVQVCTGQSGAVATSPVTFTDVTKVEVVYSSSSKGVGTIGVQIGTNTALTAQSISKSKTRETLTYTPTSAQTGAVKITCNCTTNSYGINSVTIYYQTAVTLNANGGAANKSATINHDATGTASFTACTRDGYICTGYYTASSGGTKILNANGTFASTSISSYITSSKWSYAAASLTLYAQWEVEAPSYTITAARNNDSYGNVSLSGTTITATPAECCEYASPAYTVSPTGSATVSQVGNAFTVTPSANTTVTINFQQKSAGKTVNFDAGAGVCATTSLTEDCDGSGVVLPNVTASGVCKGWTTFAGWRTSAIATADSTTTNPGTLYAAGSTYHPSTNGETLYAVFSKTKGGGTTSTKKTLTFGTSYASNSSDLTSVTIYTGITATATEGTSNNPKFYTASPGTWRMYSGSELTISSSIGNITKIEFTKSSDFNLSVKSGESGTLSSETWTYASGVSSITFNVGGTTKLSAIAVTYLAPSSTTYYCSDPNCCTALGSINGSVAWTNPTEAVVSWDNIAGVSSWTVEHKTGAGAYSTTGVSADEAYTKVSTNDSRRVTITGLSCGTEYDFRITPTPSFGYCSADPDVVNSTSSKYAITLASSGSVTGGEFIVDPEDACSGETIDIVADPSTGYDFSSWDVYKTGTPATKVSLETDDDSDGTTRSFTMPAYDVTVNATFSPQTYTITYYDGDAENASKAFSGEHADGYPTTHTYATSTTLKSATKDGFNFGGWYDNKECTGDPITSLGATAYTGNITLYAKWTSDSKWTVTISSPTNGSLSVTYTGMESALTSGSREIDKNTVLTITATPNTGYELATLTVGDEAFTSGNTHTLTDNVTIAATFTPLTYSITYKDQGDAAFSGTQTDAPSSHIYGTATTLKIPTKTGYTFQGWFTASDCASGAVGNSSAASLGATAFTGNITLYAKWALANYTITLNNQSADIEAGTTSITATYTQSTNLTSAITLPEKTGYDFQGYYTDENGGGVQLIDANGNVLANAGGGSTYTDASRNWLYTDDLTLYAHWTIKQYTVTWLVNGVESADENRSTLVNHGMEWGELTAPADPADNTLSCSDKFMGWSNLPTEWYDNDNHSEPATLITDFSGNNTEITGNITFRAVFATANVGTPYYGKVTSTAGITDGDYLIVYETDGVAFNGGLSTLDAGNNVISVTISSNKITANSTVNAAKFTIGTASGSYRTIKSASGKYIGRAGSSNGMDISESALNNTITISEGNAAVAGEGEYHLRFNSTTGDSNYRFRYYQSSKQQNIQLYKYNQDISYSNYSTKCATELEDVNATVTWPSVGTANVSWDDSEHASVWTVKYKTSNANDYTTFAGAQTTSAGRRCVDITSLGCGTNYDFKIIPSPIAGYKVSEDIDFANVRAQGYAVTLANNGATYDEDDAEKLLGTFSADASDACESGTVTITSVPALGYRFKEMEVYETATPTNKLDPEDFVIVGNEAAFEMPAYPVTVNVAFEEDPTPRITLSQTEAYAFSSANQRTSPTGLTFTVSALHLSSDLTVALSGSGASAFQLNTSAISKDGDGKVTDELVTVTPVTTTAGTFTATVTVDDGEGNATAQSFDVSITVIPVYLISWSVNGTNLTGDALEDVTTEVVDGNGIEGLPADPADNTLNNCANKFVGWSWYEIGSTALNDASDIATLNLFKTVAAAPAISADITFYAVFAERANSDGYIYIGTSGTLEDGEKYIFVDSKTAGTAHALKASAITTTASTSVASVDVTIVENYEGILITTYDTNLEFEYTSSKIKIGGNNLYINGSGIAYKTSSDYRANYGSASLYGQTNGGDNRYVSYNKGAATFGVSSSSVSMYAFKRQEPEYENYVTQCAANQVRVTYNANGGSAPSCASGVTTKDNSYTICSTEPTKDYYDFNKWNDGTSDYAAGASYDLQATTTFTAQWTPTTYTITYKLDGGTNSGDNPATYNIETATITLQSPTRNDGHDRFDGWYGAEDFSGDAITTIPTGSHRNITLYAKWTERHHIEFFKEDTRVAELWRAADEDISTAVAGQGTAPGSQATPSLCTTKSFVGWSGRDIITETETRPADLKATANGFVTSDTVLHAVWAFVTGSTPTAYSAGNTGTFVIAAYNTSDRKWYAIPQTPTLSSKKITGVEITVNNTDDIYHVTSANASGYEWTIANATYGQTLSDGSKYLYHSNGGASGTDLAYADGTDYTWKIVLEEGGLTVQGAVVSSATTNARGLLLSGTTFGGYALSNEGVSGFYRIQILPIHAGKTYASYSTSCFYTFEPSGGTSKGNWSVAANWSGGVVPTIDTKVVIADKEMTVDVPDAAAKEVVLTGTSQLIINAGMALTVAGNVTKDGSQTSVGDVVLHSTKAAGTGALIMNPANVTVAPKATVEQATKTGKIDSDWINQHVGTPFSDGNSYNNWYGSYVYYYDAAGGSWVNVKRNTSDASLVPFRGYNVLRSDATTFWMQGTVNQPITDDVELSAVKNGGETTTENMFANSWLAPINILAMEDADFVNINKVIYIFNAGTPAQYAELTDAGTTSADGGTAAAQWMALPIDAVKDAPSSFTYTVIPSMQGFKVLANAADAKLKLNYDKLVYQPALDLLDAGEDLPIKPNLAPEMRHSTDDKPEVLALNVRGESGYGDRVLLFVRDDFTNGYDDGWEGSKMTGMSIAPQMYAVSDDGNMSIDAVPAIEGTVIGFRAGQDNNYTFTFRYEGNDVLYLNDMLTETSTRIHEGFTYDFTTADGDIETRFVISHTPFVKTTPTGLDNVQGDEGQSVRKLFYQGVMYIIRGGRIYNAEGARIQ